MSEVKSTDNAKPMNIMFVGDTSVGKTMFIKKYVTGEFTEGYISTIGIDFMTKEMEFCENPEDEEAPTRKIKLQLWDTAGQERYKSICRAYYRQSKAFILVFDVTNEQSINKIDNWLDEIRGGTAADNPKIVLCGNKVDLEEQRKVDEETIRKKAEELGLEYFETSANTGGNINEAVNCVVHLVVTGKVPGEESEEEEVDEEALKKEVEDKVKLEDGDATGGTTEKKASKCAC